ncbi:hypothetical protein [Ruegeria sp. HKCCD6119]|uniref:hypothetical protein n=1 Tax=Ruegeria sp. HKCCD6119 TaxID=2683003 RepID=UPI001491ED16|nr:hypothetical protein [Ruegeria sp. HKCCD6119]NOD84476.1 hypothetical protein [Ruegeria sp. HKCCD6119]
MILETLRLFFLFVVAVSILPLSILAARNYARSKRTIVDGMARLDEETLDRLGWEAREYIGTFDLFAPFRMGWAAWGLAVQKQRAVLQRILLQSLPDSVVLPGEISRSLRRYRCLFWAFFAPVTVLVLFSAFIRLSHVLAGFSGLPLSLCFIWLGAGNGVWIFTPLEKFRKWPEIEDLS